jgi:hypothetical protein
MYTHHTVSQCAIFVFVVRCEFRFNETHNIIMKHEEGPVADWRAGAETNVSTTKHNMFRPIDVSPMAITQAITCL